MARFYDLMDRAKALDDRKNPWMDFWQQLADIFLPHQADFTRLNQPAEPRGVSIYDGTPRLAARDLATTLDGLTKPKSVSWFDVDVLDEDLKAFDDVKLWLDIVKDRMWNHIYRKDARFIQRSGEVDMQLAVYGWGPLWTQENALKNGLLFKSFHLSKVAIDENSEGIVDTITIKEMLNARQAHDKILSFGKAPGKHIMEVLQGDRKKIADSKFEFVQIVLPNTDLDAKAFGKRRMPFLTALIDVKDEKIIHEDGFFEFPAACPRWETAPGEIYARSPAMIALPDAQTLQAMGKTLLVGGQRAVDPPIWVLNDSIMSPLRTFPGGVTVLDTSDGNTPVGSFPVTTNLPVGREMQQDYRIQVEAAFFKNIFNLPIETRQMTATEIVARKEEFIRVIGPVFGRLETDYIGHIVERVFGIMDRAGAFPPRPDVLQDQKITFKFRSPIQQARKQMEIASLSNALTMLAPLAEVQPHIIDRIDGEEVVKDSPDWGGLPHRWIKSDKKVEEERAARQEAGELEQTLAASGPVSQAIKNVAQADALMQQ